MRGMHAAVSQSQNVGYNRFIDWMQQCFTAWGAAKLQQICAFVRYTRTLSKRMIKLL